MTKLTKSQLQEITNIYLLANTPKSLLRALLKTSVVDALRRDCSTEELFHSYNRITTKAKRSPFVAALAYCSLIALLVKAPAKSECPDASYLQWGTIIESHLAREFGTTETVIITSNSPNPTVRLVSTGGMPLRSTQDSPTKPTTQFFS